MLLATGDAAKVVTGALLLIAGIWSAKDALRTGYVPYSGGADRTKWPISYWISIAVFVGVAMVGLDLLISGVAHIHTIFG